MTDPVDLYDSHYEHVEAEVYRAVRAEAFGEDLGQTSWITAGECDAFAGWLGLGPGMRLLEVACGSGGATVRMAERLDVSVVGVDVNEDGVAAASARARDSGLDARAEFRVADANQPLPFADGTFDAVFCNDAINHLRDRQSVLADWYRLLQPGGRCLYTDPIVVTGSLSADEIRTRSSIGFYLFTPPGVNEALLREVGFRRLLRADVTDSVTRTSRRWRQARAARRDALCEIEGNEGFEELQHFLATVHTLAREGRLSRFAYMGSKRRAAAET